MIKPKVKTHGEDDWDSLLLHFMTCVEGNEAKIDN